MTKIVQAQNTNQSQILLQADSQSFDPKTKNLSARGNVMFSLPQQHLDARADEVEYSQANQQLILTGNVRLIQRGKLMQGARIVCQLKAELCQSLES